MHRIKTERGISYTEAKRQIDIFNSVKTTDDQAAAATKPVIKTANIEMQTEMTWPEGTKQPKNVPFRSNKTFPYFNFLGKLCVNKQVPFINPSTKQFSILILTYTFLITPKEPFSNHQNPKYY